MAASITVSRQFIHHTKYFNLQSSSSRGQPRSLVIESNHSSRTPKLAQISGHRSLIAVAKASSRNAGDEEGVSLGTMKLPLNTDLPRFETLLFQWANSLCQGAGLPLPVPLKVDKIPGGARLGFITIEDAKTEVLVYIDCLVFPATDGSGPIFRAIRDGPTRDRTAPGEQRIMKSLLQALQKSVQIARV